MFGRQVTLFEIFGFRVKVDLSWAFLALLIAWSLAQGLFPSLYQGLTVATYWWMAVVGVVGVLVSLVFHELSHSLVARRFGLEIRGITLFLFGGVAEMQEEPMSAKVEFWMAVAGPLASLFLAGVFYGLAALGQSYGAPPPVWGIASYLGFLNLLLAGFNLIPAFPMDGGRVLRAALWYRWGDLKRATRAASRAGSLFGLALVGLGLFNLLSGNFVGGFWWFLIGLFIRQAAASSLVQLQSRQMLTGEPVRRFMTDDPVAVPHDTTVRAFVEDYLFHHGHDFYPVVAGDRLLGSIETRQIKAVPRALWDETTVGEIARPLDATITIEAGGDAVQALARMQRDGVSRLIVVERGRLVGLLTLKDLMKLLALRLELEQE
ncbi:Zn-dependent protease (includes SpoIVFB) [Tistlia consotensis]|uniref:Zinc metalloprotease n=1 Tax=Tistlia consotensis USBA 355 TaxID=560819 RepID=A0A1Y6BP44_9PROT|nr:site-2 protease family protein [Tistlia consotensis]SMF12920.1 Zn-dependent protease (includes SpoIVFB) [Tistlia consotensis USBA 355]SNR50825.1 Zn-dependent protease (includes SpoIVFB) [Tistlia consotensis]